MLLVIICDDSFLSQATLTFLTAWWLAKQIRKLLKELKDEPQPLEARSKAFLEATWN